MNTVTLVFWGLALLLTTGAVLLLLLPLLRTGTGVMTPAAMEQARLTVHYQQLRDLEADRANGLLEDSQFERARADLERGLLEDSRDTDPPEAGHTAPNRRLTMVLLGLAVPALALVTYLQVGSGQAGLEPARQAPAMVAPGEHDMDRLLDDLRARMADRPDPRGWALLARSLAAIGREDQALEAYQQALAQGGDRDPAVLAQYAELLVATTGSARGRPLELVRQALALDPDHPQSLWLAGAAAYEDQDYRAARQFWQRLRDVLPADSEGVPVIEEELRALEPLLGEGG